jgi:acyl-CoA dehydrogenase
MESQVPNAAEIQQFRTEARDWLNENAPLRERTEAPLPPLRAAGGGRGIAAAKDMQARLAEAGFAGITWPQEFGGRGASFIYEVTFDEEAEQYELPTEVFAIGQGLAGPTILHHGTDEHRARYLKRILTGEDVWCQMFSEPDAGSDLASLRTRAVRDGDEYVINGQKIWSSGAQISDFGVIVCRTDPDKPKHRGLSYFIVDMTTPGIAVRPLREMTGEHHFCEVFLEDVRVPATNLVGERNGGWKVVQTTLMNERMVGGGLFAFDVHLLINLARSTEISGHPATEHPHYRQQLAQMYERTAIMRYLRARQMAAVLAGRGPGPEGSIAKFLAGLINRDAAALALELQGAHGTLAGQSAIADGSWQALFLAAPAMRIAGGSDEIQRNIIGERILGLPREPPP